MSRRRGTFTIDTNYDVSITKPFDARSLVPTYEDLLDETNWKTNNRPIAYNGMLVSVANTNDTSKNGVYMLFDRNATAFVAPDVTNPAHWKMVNTSAETINIQVIDGGTAVVN